MTPAAAASSRAAIVGAGPAGSAVSEVLAASGVAHDLFDEQPRAGGNIARRRFDAPPSAPEAVAGVRVHGGCRVLSLSREHVVEWDDGAAVRRRAYEAVFLCAGAYDGMQPRAGRHDTWSAAGALQALLKGQGIVPRGRVLICGTGPFLHVVAADLARAGASVVAVVDAMPLLGYLNLLPYATALPTNIRTMLDAHRALYRAGVKTRFGRRVVRLDRQEAVLDDGSRLAFDLAGISDWFAPQTQLARSAGCAQAWSTAGGYFYTQVDGDYRSDVAGIFVCGEGAGVRGGPHARLSGLIAALAWLQKAGLPAPDGYDADVLRRRARDIAMFGQALEVATMACGTRPADDAWACACERATIGAVRQAVAAGLHDLSSIKIVTRCGMGPCQGRYCEPVVGRIIAETGAVPRAPLSQKVLARPVDVAELARG